MFLIQAFKTSHTLAVANWNLRELMFAAKSSGAARATRLPNLFTEDDQKVILDRREVESRAEVIAETQSAHAQILRDISIEELP